MEPPAHVVVSAPDFGRVSGEALQLLREGGCRITSNPGGTLSEDTLLLWVAEADAMIAGVEPVTARVLDAAPRLKVIARRGVGYDTVDVGAATERGVAVTITAGALTDAVADHAIALLLAVARRVPQLDRLVKSGGWGRLPAVDIAGKTLGLLGFGAIGRAVARRAAGFGMRILACDALPDTAAAEALGVTLCDRDTVLAESDFVSLHVPLGPTTRGMIGEAALQRMKPSAYLINTSRGPVVDEAALLRALRGGRLAGAGLDVFEQEPTSNHELVQLDSVVATPHAASNTIETMARVERACAEAVLAALNGRRPAHVVNPQVYDR